jgi:NAD+ synthase (glutamine-hydrolysing)
MGCDGDRLYFDGSAIISLNGQLLAQSPQFSLKACEVVCGTADLDLIQILRGNRPSFTNQSAAAHQLFPTYARIKCEGIKLCCTSTSTSTSTTHSPTTPAQEPHFLAEEEEIGLGPALWMWDYLRKCGGRGFFLPLSGGLDSASCALIVFCLAQFLAEKAAGDAEVRDELTSVLGPAADWNAARITNRLLYTCYFGTSNSTAASQSRAEKLAITINRYHQLQLHIIQKQYLHTLFLLLVSIKLSLLTR